MTGEFDDIWDMPDPSPQQPAAGGHGWTRTPLGAAASGALDAFSLGFGDEISGAAAGLGSMAQGGDYRSAFDARVRRARANLAQARQMHPGWTTAGTFAGSLGSFILPGAAIGQAARLGRLGSGIAGFTARAGGRGLGAYARQVGIAGGTGLGAGALYGYGSGDNLANPDWGHIGASALIGGGSAALLGPAINAAARGPAGSLARHIGLGRPAGAPRISGHTLNATDRALGATGDDVAGLARRMDNAPPGARVVDVADAPGGPSAFRAQYDAAGGPLGRGRAQRAARIAQNTGGRNVLGALADVATHNPLGAAARMTRNSLAPLSSPIARENQNVLRALSAAPDSSRTRELLRLLGHRESGRVSRGSTEAYGEGFGNAAFFGGHDNTYYDPYDTMTEEELDREIEQLLEEAE